MNEFTNSLSFYPTEIDLEEISNDSILLKKRERWEQSLSKDIYVEEAVNILNDLNKVAVNYNKVVPSRK